MDGTRVLRRALNLKFKGKRHMGRFRARWFSQALSKELARNLKVKNFGKLLVHQPA
jgi:hypothetical protein